MGLFWAKYARRIFAIVSTTSIPNPAPVSPTEATVDPPSRGSRLDADHPENGVLIPCRFTIQAELQRNRVGLQTGLANDLPLVPGDRVQLQQVIVNLIVNALDAMA